MGYFLVTDSEISSRRHDKLQSEGNINLMFLPTVIFIIAEIGIETS
jgi:hypothetical protein